MKKPKRWVVKAGSTMVCGGGALLIRTWMQQILELRRRHNIEVIWVTSGAIAWAMQRTQFHKTRNLARRQALSAIGQPLIMDQYNLALQATSLLGSQVLLSASDMKHKIHRRNLQGTLNELLHMKVIPILNENDAVATEEICFGDNDSLAALVAVMMGAEKLILMTDVNGLYDADPKTNPRATLISYRRRVSRHEFSLADKSVSQFSSGGMYSKLTAARRANQDGIVAHLVRGDLPNNLLDIAAGKNIGTQIGGKI